MTNVQQTLLGKRTTDYFSWKGFWFPVAVQEFVLQEPTKVATYSYAGRNGAEHERVLDYRILTIKGEFVESSGVKSPLFYVQKLRVLNDNKPGVFLHKDFGEFTCILKGLVIGQSGKSQEVLSSGEIGDSYEFTLEFWEHTDPADPSLSDELRKLFPAVVVKPPSDDYATRLDYRTPRRLFQAIQNGKIQPGTDPIRHAEWLAYPQSLRTAAYDQWVAFQDTGVDPYAVVKIKTEKQKIYTVQPGENLMKVAVKTKASGVNIFNLNRGREVRESSETTSPTSGWFEGNTWKTPFDLRVGDKIILPEDIGKGGTYIDSAYQLG